MPAPANYRVKGAFFENNNNPNGPAFTGFVEIDGQRTDIVLWPKTSAKGINYFQVSEDKKKPQSGATSRVAPRSPFGNRQPSNPAPKKTDPDMDDDIPF